MAVFHLDETLQLPDAPLFLDTCAWLPCLCPAEQHAQPERARVYPLLLEKQHEGKCQMCTCLTQISEYWNRRLRIEHSSWQKSDKSKRGQIGYKVFRDEHRDVFFEAVKAAHAEVNDILSASSILNPLERLDANEVIEFAFAHTIDFNDALYYLICKKFKLTLVTEDNDFIPFVNNIDIVTMSTAYP